MSHDDDATREPLTGEPLTERQRAQAREYDEALGYLRHAGELEDRWILTDERPYWRLTDLAPRLVLSEESLRSLAKLGATTDGAEGLPGAFMNSPQAGWQIPRRGVVLYLARRSRAMRQGSGGRAGQEQVG